MNLKSVLVPTEVARAGMTVRQVFEECLRAHTPGLPFCDEHGLVTGRVTLKYILKRQYLPEHLVELVMVLGEQKNNIQEMETLGKQLFDSKIDSYLQRPHASITSTSSIIKALALMEKLDTGYLFVIDEGQYIGTVTLQILSKAILQHDNSSRSI